MKFLSLFRTRLIDILCLACFLLMALASTTVRAADYGTIQLNRALAYQDTQYNVTDKCIAMRIKWIGGTIGSASIAVASNGDLTFLNAAGTADTNLVASTGVVAVATYATFGKVAAVINASTNWRCTLVGVRPSQASACLVAVSATATGLTNNEGLALLYQTATLHMVSAVIGPEWMTDSQFTASNNDLLNRRSTPLGDPLGPTWQNELLYVTTTMTATAPSLYVYAVKDDADAATEILLWQQLGATGTASTIPVLPKQAPIKAPPGWRLIVQYIGTAGGTSASIQVHGLTYVSKPGN